MSLLDRVNARHAARRGDRKQFLQPPFWQADALRQSLVGSSGWAADREQIEHDFEGYAAQAGKSSGPVFACHYARLRVFCDGQFLWRDRADGQLGQWYDSDELGLLRRPWPGGTLSNLLAWMEVDATYAGNSYATTVDDRGRYGNASRGGPGRRIARLRPDWVTLVIGSHSDDPYAPDARVVGMVYKPPTHAASAMESDRKPVLLLPNECMHYSPVPDPSARFRGMSWLTPVLREIGADKAATSHKLKHFENGAALQTVVSLDKDISPDAFKEFVALFRGTHEGSENAYKTLFLGGGADVNVVGTDMQKLDFRAITGSTETRIAAAAGVHPVVVGLSEGLSGSSLNAGNYAAARRNVADGTLQHLWTEAASSLETLFERPKPAAELCIDKRDVAFVREDAKDIAEIQRINAAALRQLVDAGYEPDAAVEFLRSDDIARLVGRHSGLYSVQLQPPGTADSADPGTAPERGDGDSGKRGSFANWKRHAFNPDQPRASDGRWGSTAGPSAGDSDRPVNDPLKLADRIRLGPGESFGGSAVVGDGSGESSVALARVDGPNGPRVRFGVVNAEDKRRWSAEPKGSTVEFGEDGIAEIRTVLTGVLEEGKASIADYRAQVRQAIRDGVPDGEFPDTFADIGRGVVAGSRWGNVQWEATREEGGNFITVAGQEVIGADLLFEMTPKTGSDSVLFSTRSVSAIKKLDKALEDLMPLEGS